MRTKKIKPDGSYQYMVYDGGCLIFENTKRITTMALPKADNPEDLEIRLREEIIFRYGIHPNNLTKSDKVFKKRENNFDYKIVEL